MSRRKNYNSDQNGDLSDQLIQIIEDMNGSTTTSIASKLAWQLVRESRDTQQQCLKEIEKYFQETNTNRDLVSVIREMLEPSNDPDNPSIHTYHAILKNGHHPSHQINVNNMLRKRLFNSSLAYRAH